MKIKWVVVSGFLMMAAGISQATRYSCPQGIVCDGTPITGAPNQQVCGTDLHMYACTRSGWQRFSTTCNCVIASSPTYSCGGGTLCGGQTVTGTPDQQVCGTDLKSWVCTVNGWQSTNRACRCS